LEGKKGKPPRRRRRGGRRRLLAPAAGACPYRPLPLSAPAEAATAAATFPSPRLAALRQG